MCPRNKLRERSQTSNTEAGGSLAKYIAVSGIYYGP